MRHPADSGRGPATDEDDAPSVRRPARTLRGDEVGAAEIQFAAEISRLPRRFGVKADLDGFLAWRVYTTVRAAWWAWHRARRSVERVLRRQR